ncbi:MAG: hypothetical protein ACP5RQ_02655, partial [Candidatus Micrarchaeia archaeon]
MPPNEDYKKTEPMKRYELYKYALYTLFLRIDPDIIKKINVNGAKEKQEVIKSIGEKFLLLRIDSNIEKTKRAEEINKIIKIIGELGKKLSEEDKNNAFAELINSLENFSKEKGIKVKENMTNYLNEIFEKGKIYTKLFE